MKNRRALITAIVGVIVSQLLTVTSAQEVSHTMKAPAVFPLESESATAPLRATGIACRIETACEAGSSPPGGGSAESHKFDIFGGFSYLNDGALFTRVSAYGWDLQGTWNLSRLVGFTADFSGHNGSTKNVMFLIAPIPQVDQDAYFFLFGPKFTARTEKFEMFGHFLVGAAHGRFEAIVPGLGGIALPGFAKDTNFALAMGGGVDYFFSNHWGWRMVQGDYLFSQLTNTPIHSVRIATGIVWRR